MDLLSVKKIRKSKKRRKKLAVEKKWDVFQLFLHEMFMQKHHKSIFLFDNRFMKTNSLQSFPVLEICNLKK